MRALDAHAGRTEQRPCCKTAASRAKGAARDPQRYPCVTHMRYPCVMNVNQAAEQMKVTPGRVRALIKSGRISAHRSGRRWEIDSLSPTRTRRPLSEKSRRQLAAALHSRSLRGLDGQARARTAERLRLLRSVEDPGALLLEWWGGTTEDDDRFIRSLLRRAAAGDRDGVRETLRKRRPAYLASTALLADTVGTERRIQGLNRAQLALLADVPETTVRLLERGAAMRTPGPSRRVLKALDIVPTALPPMEMSR